MFSSIFAHVFQVISFLQVFLQDTACISLLPHSATRPATSYSLMWSTEQYLSGYTSYSSAFHHFSGLLLLALSQVQIPSPAPYSSKPSAYVLSSIRGVKFHTCYRWFLVRDQITVILGGLICKLRLVELIIKLLEFERNLYWHMGWRLKCHTGRFGPQGHKTSRIRPCCREEWCGYPDWGTQVAFVALIPAVSMICTFVNSTKWGHLFHERTSGPEAAHAGFGKLLVTGPRVPRLHKEQECQSRLGSDKSFGAVLNLLEPELFFLILAHTIYKMWIIQEPNKLEL